MDWTRQTTNIMRRCDKDESGSIEREEFGKYYEQITSDMFRCASRACVRALAYDGAWCV